jgi:predicted secreted protein
MDNNMDKTVKILIIAVLVIFFSFGVIAVGIKLVGWGFFIVHVGETFNVVLTENSASTGYSWQVTSINSNIVNLIKTEYTVPELIGGEGKVIMTFKALEAGTAIIVLQCTRALEGNLASITGTYVVSVVVSP